MIEKIQSTIFKNDHLDKRIRFGLGNALVLALLAGLPVAMMAGVTHAQTASPAPSATAPSAAPAAAPAPAATPAAAPAPAAPDFSTVQIKTTDLGHNLYMLEGRGGNITVAVTRDGILMVDSQFAPLHDKILAAIRAVSDKPIRYLINTHFHGDHVGGNAAFAKDGAVIVAQENVKKRLVSGTTNGITGAKAPPADAAALPSKTYDKTMTLRLGGLVAQLYHAPDAHTDGDTYIWFKADNILATGDNFATGHYPLIDFANGGSIKGIIDINNHYISMVNGKTKVVAGHGALASKADLIAFRDVMVAARDRIAALIKAGKSEDDVVASKPLADYDAKWATDPQAGINFVRSVYRSLSGKKSA